MSCVIIGQRSDEIFTQAYPVLSSWVEREMQPGGEGDAAGWTGRRSWVERETQLGGEGDAAGWRRRKARGGRLDGPGRLFGRPEASNQTARGG